MDHTHYRPRTDSISNECIGDEYEGLGISPTRPSNPLAKQIERLVYRPKSLLPYMQMENTEESDDFLTNVKRRNEEDTREVVSNKKQRTIFKSSLHGIRLSDDPLFSSDHHKIQEEEEEEEGRLLLMPPPPSPSSFSPEHEERARLRSERLSEELLFGLEQHIPLHRSVSDLTGLSSSIQSMSFRPLNPANHASSAHHQGALFTQSEGEDNGEDDREENDDDDDDGHNGNDDDDDDGLFAGTGGGFGESDRELVTSSAPSPFIQQLIDHEESMDRQDDERGGEESGDGMSEEMNTAHSASPFAMLSKEGQMLDRKFRNLRINKHRKQSRFQVRK